MNTTTQPRPPSRLARRAAAPLVALLVLGACSGDDDADTTTADTEETTGSTVGSDTTMAMETTALAAETTTASSAAPTTAEPATTAAATTTPASTAPPSTVPVPFEFADPGGAYTATFPGEPTAIEQPTTLPDGTELPITFYLFEDATGAAFGTAAIAYPEGTALDLQGAQDGAIASVQGTLVESAPIELQGRTGIQFAADVGGQGTYISRIFADGLNLYQVVAVVQGAVTAEEPTVAAFLDSFQFTT